VDTLTVPSRDTFRARARAHTHTHTHTHTGSYLKQTFRTHMHTCIYDTQINDKGLYSRPDRLPAATFFFKKKPS